ncbi:MAG: glycosyltransferase family 2 protein [Candidatus Krumholzibacteria bacterium]|nr:glycosyltransferase family 2 protein [Candidatus Krumholzibacteria bacterium]MDP6669772.1 glycosyltransferase family 2 protein [Candidatus Krumholzibacteria bacterium]MDP6796752.1 glycosyltransferase family 2 protein [Candidatus Krumholzibacteria bacterium]MDP7021694.1 glycosyltransferase family 2 protein [Candidatus Krumholzibacteria bacterium]
MADTKVTTPPKAGLETLLPKRGRVSPALFVLLGFLGVVILGSAQIYYFTRLDPTASGMTRGIYMLTVVFSTSVLFFATVSGIRYFLMMLAAYLGWNRAQARRLSSMDYWPRVSVLVPAYNESTRVLHALESVLQVDYHDLEIVVIDDGSTDDTFDLACAFAGEHEGKTVRVLKKANAKKSSALNLGFHKCTGELIMCVDADSILDVNSVKAMVRNFADPELGGVAGQVRVRNRGNMITRLQALEYTMMNGMPRMAQSFFASVLISPGPVSMFRRSALNDVWKASKKYGDRYESSNPARVDGPWEDDTFAEDADLTLNVLLTGSGVIYDSEAISYTAAPTWTFDLLNQRYRWFRGNLQAVRKVWRRWRKSPGAPSKLALWMGFFLVEAILWPFVNMYGMFMFVLLILTTGMVANTILITFCLLFLIDLNAAAFSISVENEDRKLAILSPILRIFYMTLLDVNSFFALLDEFRHKKMTW